MGLIYNPSDSHGLVSALNANIRTADEMIKSLNRASKHLIDALGNNSLSGAAYTAGKGMFSQLVLPTISKASQALDKLKSEAKQYEGFASNAGEELLDEDKLNEQLQNLQTQQAALSSQISFYNQLAASHSDDSALNTSYSDSSRQLSSFMGTTASDIQKVQEKLKKLHEFNTNVSSLFKNSLSELKAAMSAINVINDSKVDEKSGKFSLPKGIDLSNFKNILTVGAYSVTSNVISKEWKASKVKISKGTWHGSEVASTKSGLKTWRQVNGDVNRFKAVKGAKNLDEIVNGTGKIADGVKSIGLIGGIGAAVDGLSTYEERKSEYGQLSAAIDGTVHTSTAVGSIYAGAAIGSLIPIPVVGTVAGAVGGYLVNSVANTLYDGFAHGKWNLDNFKLW